MSLYLQETAINRTKNYSLGESSVYESRYDSTGEAYKGLRKEFGRCSSKMFIDTKSKGTIQTGWVFVKRMPYDDSKETFLQETWVSLHVSLPTLQHHYASFD